MVRRRWLILDELALSHRMIISVCGSLMYKMQLRIDNMLSILALMKSYTYKLGPIGQLNVFWLLSNILKFIDVDHRHRTSIASALLVIDDLCSYRWRLYSGPTSTNIWMVWLMSLSVPTILLLSRYHAFSCRLGMMLCTLRR